MNKKVLVILVLVAAVLAGGWYYYQNSHKETELKLYGNVDIRQVSLSFNASERIASVNVEEGDTVKKGQVLAQLDTTTLQLNIAKMRAQVAAQEATYNNDLTDYGRMESLYNRGAIAKQQLDHTDASLKVAQANLDLYKAELKTMEYNLSQATLVAPQDGVIRSRLLEPGDMASASKTVFLLGTNDMKWVRVYIPEKRLGQIKEGLEAQVVIDSFPDKPLKGQVGYISNTAEFTPKSVQTEELRTSLLYEVRIYVKDEENVLRMGMPATVTFPSLQ